VNKRDESPTLETVSGVPIPESPYVSPCGEGVVYTLRTVDRELDRDVRTLWLVSASGGDSRRLTSGPGDRNPAYAPHGRSVAFLRDQDEGAQLWLVHLPAGTEERLTDLGTEVSDFRWSADGRLIAFLALSSGHGGDSISTTPAVHASDPIVVETSGYKSDGSAFRRGLTKQLFVLDTTTLESRKLTNCDGDVACIAWSRDGTRLAYAASVTASSDSVLSMALYVIGLDGGPPRKVGSLVDKVLAVDWLEDDRALVFGGSTEVSVGMTSIYRQSLDRLSAQTILTDLDLALELIGVDRATELVVFAANDGGTRRVYALDANTAELVCQGSDDAVSLGEVRLGPPTTGSGVASAPDTFGEVALIDLVSGDVTTLTCYTRAALPDADFVRPEPREFRISDGTIVHGWLIRDPSVSGPIPLLLDIHGGPFSAWGPGLNSVCPYHQLFVASGWSVLLLNPRGSDGYGAAFAESNVGACGIGDVADLLEPVDVLVAEESVDPGRLAVTGYSYGGFMTCALTTVTERFSAAVAGACVSDLASELASSDLGIRVGLHYGQVTNGDPQRLDDQSPIRRVSNVRTPTLLLHGMDDARCPVGQSEEWFSALCAREIPARMVLYPGASHNLRTRGRPSHRLDYGRQLVNWMNQHLGPPDIDV
jgi:dipeptidyl aminopeptidase/acylaminoacyl peptidase